MTINPSFSRILMILRIVLKSGFSETTSIIIIIYPLTFLKSAKNFANPISVSG